MLRSLREGDSSAASAVLLASGAALLGLVGMTVALGFLVSRPQLLPYFPIAAAVGMLVLWRPAWLLPVFVGLTWTAIDQSHFGGFSPVQTGGMAFLLLAAWFGWRDLDVTREVLLTCTLLALPIFASAMVIPGGPLQPRDEMKTLSFLVIAALCVRGTAGVRRTVRVLVIVGIFLGLGAAFSVLVAPTGLFPLELDPAGVEAPRAAGPYGESNFFALSLAALVPFALYEYSTGGWRRWLGIASGISLLMGIFATGSRGALIGVAFALGTFALFSGRREARRGALVVLLAAAAATPLFLSQANSSASRSVSGRATENRIALQMFLDHPLLGVGPEQYEPLYRSYSRRIGNDSRPLREPHSLYLQIAAEQGIVGLLGWLGAAMVVVRYAIRRRVGATLLGKAVLTSVGVWLLCSLFLHAGQLRLFYVLVGLVFALGADKLPLPVPRRARPVRRPRPVRPLPAAPTPQPTLLERLR
ncbi:MAG: O-antigen ligase family protein [Actinobacteria bacterium]|nr:O-antigen ligase family protein [Actinomycetota bacterium]